MPKPVATMYGLCRDSLLFFHGSRTEGVKSKRSSGKIGRIRVDGGVLSIPQIIKELSFLIPGDHQWEVTKVDDNSYKVVYPTKADFARVRKINDIKVDDTSCTIFFEEWSTQELESWKLHSAWVRVGGCPKDLRDDYLALFAVGSVIGKTEEVDMAFTREHEIVRMRVLCINPHTIPHGTDYHYGDEGFPITFEVEDPVFIPPQDEDMTEANQENDDAASKEKDVTENNSAVNGKSAKNDVTNNSVNVNKGSAVNTKQTQLSQNFRIGSFAWEFSEPDSPLIPLGFQSVPNTYKKPEVTPVRLLSVGHNREPLSSKWGDRVEVEEDDLPSPLPSRIEPVEVTQHERKEDSSPMTLTMHTQPLETAAAGLLPLFSAVADSPAAGDVAPPSIPAGGLSSEICVFPHPQSPVVPGGNQLQLNEDVYTLSSTAQKKLLQRKEYEANEIVSHPSSASSSQRDSPRTPGGGSGSSSKSPMVHATSSVHGSATGTGVFLGGRFSREEVVAFGGVPEASVDVRSSDRIRAQPNADATQLERAQALAQARSGGSCAGDTFGYSLDPYVVLSPTRGGVQGYGHWVQPIGNGCTGYVYPVRLAF